MSVHFAAKITIQCDMCLQYKQHEARILIFWDVMLCRGSSHPAVLKEDISLKIKALRSLAMSTTQRYHPMRQECST